MAITPKQRRELQNLVKDLSKYRGRHTELVSVYIPAGYDLNKINTHVAQEQGTATNIKSKGTRDNVIAALEKIIQHLKLFPRTPPNGLAVFSGNVAERDGQQDVQVWSIEPPEPLNQRLYRCDKLFVLDPLESLIETKELYGLIVLDRRDANVALLRGKSIVPIIKTHSQVPGKHKAGGQSAQRFERLTEGAALDHYKKVAHLAKENFLGRSDIKGIIVGGPGQTKHEFLEKGQLTQELKDKVIGVKDLSYTGEFGLQELVDKSQDILAKEEIAGEKAIMNQFFHLLATKPGMVEYGEKEVQKKLELGAIDTILISEECSDSLIAKFEEQADATGTTVIIISTETREGVQLRDMGKIAALLRYEGA